MKITVTNQSQTLEQLLSTQQKAQVKNTVEMVKTKTFLIQNKSGNSSDLYIDLGATVTTDTGLKIPAGYSFQFVEDEASDVYLISGGADIDVTVIIGQ